MAYHDFTYENVLASSLRAQWQLDDVLAPDQDLDFLRKFLPDAMTGIDSIAGLSDDERRILNHICAYQYLHYFGTIEEIVLPFVLDHARPMLNTDDYRVRALLNFAGEEAKHIHLFNRFKDAFKRGFPIEPELLGPPEQLRDIILSHHPFAVALNVLMIEWMTQSHYVDSVRGDPGIDPLFKSLLKNHWKEEAQHAKMDTLIVDALAAETPPDEVPGAINGFLAIAHYFLLSVEVQAEMNIRSFERAVGRKVQDPGAMFQALYRAAARTYVLSGILHPKFGASIRAVVPDAVSRISTYVASEFVNPKTTLPRFA